MHKYLIQTEGEQICAHLTMDIRFVMHIEARIKVDKVKVEFKAFDNALSLSISMGGDHLQALQCFKLMTN